MWILLLLFTVVSLASEQVERSVFVKNTDGWSLRVIHRSDRPEGHQELVTLSPAGRERRVAIDARMLEIDNVVPWNDDAVVITDKGGRTGHVNVLSLSGERAPDFFRAFNIAPAPNGRFIAFHSCPN